MLILGCLIVLAALFLLVKRYEARMVLVCAGIVMCLASGAPMKALDAFAKGMGSGMISSACSSMGFALAMRFTGCDKHLINALAKLLLKVNWLLIPGVIFGTYAVNVALPSAAGTAAAAGAIFIPILMGAGVHPAMAAAAVKCGTYGSMLNPGLAHNPFVAKIAGVNVMDVIAFHYKANIASLLVGAVVLTAIAYFLKENKGHVVEGLELDTEFKVNPLYALMPVVPIAILILGATKMVPMFKMGVAQAMVIGAILTCIVTRTNPAALTKSFFDGMGKAYGDIIGIILAAGVFVRFRRRGDLCIQRSGYAPCGRLRYVHRADGFHGYPGRHPGPYHVPDCRRYHHRSRYRRHQPHGSYPPQCDPHGFRHDYRHDVPGILIQA